MSQTCRSKYFPRFGTAWYAQGAQPYRQALSGPATTGGGKNVLVGVDGEKVRDRGRLTPRRGVVDLHVCVPPRPGPVVSLLPGLILLPSMLTATDS